MNHYSVINKQLTFKVIEFMTYSTGKQIGAGECLLFSVEIGIFDRYRLGSIGYPPFSGYRKASLNIALPAASLDSQVNQYICLFFLGFYNNHRRNLRLRAASPAPSASYRFDPIGGKVLICH